MIRTHLTEAIERALSDLGVESPDSIGLERPANPDHGDWSSNVALATAKNAGRNPRELATAIADHISAEPPTHVEQVEIAGPGFVNFRLSSSWLHEVLRTVVEEGTEQYGRSDSGAGTTVIVEFVSANPNKPLHAGHGRGACLGDSIARLLERTGHTVTRETYLNDRGVQMQLFAESLAARQQGIEPPADGYHGDYVSEWAAEMPIDADPLEWGYARALQSHRSTLERLDIDFAVWFSERTLLASGAIDAAIADLGEHDVIYEREGATWFRSSDYGDDKDRVLVKSDGELTYLLPDIAYHRDKFSRASRLVNIWGADHHGYVVRMKAAMQALGHEPDELRIVITQLVDFVHEGEQVRMAGRSGELIELDALIDEVGADAARFTYLMQSADTRHTIDLDLLASTTMDNPVFYVQMAHARLRSIQRKLADEGIDVGSLADAPLGQLTHERELDVLRALWALPDLTALAAAEHGPHKIANWSRELAAATHGFYHDCYVIGEGISPELTRARAWLVEAARIGLAIGLDLLGVAAPESM